MTKSRTEKAIITTLTPDAARKLLANNEHNRPLNNRRIHRLSRAILDGRWKFNGASIVIDRKGRMLDGQHRCHAVVRANKSIDTVLVTGVTPEAFDTIDQGAKRSGADIFSLCGVSNPAVVSSSLTIVYQNRKGIAEGGDGSKGMIADMDERVELFDSIPNYEEIIKSCTQYRKQLSGLVPLPMMAGMYFLFHEKSRSGAQFFMKNFAHGTNDPQNPANCLRVKFEELAEQEYRISRQTRCAYIKLAWNAFVSGERVNRLELPRTLDIPIKPLGNRFWIDNAKN